MYDYMKRKKNRDHENTQFGKSVTSVTSVKCVSVKKRNEAKVITGYFSSLGW